MDPLWLAAAVIFLVGGLAAFRQARSVSRDARRASSAIRGFADDLDPAARALSVARAQLEVDVRGVVAHAREAAEEARRGRSGLRR